MMGDIIMEIVYGMADAENVNKYHQIADEVISMIAVGQLPGAYMVNFIPACTSSCTLPNIKPLKPSQ